MSYAKTTALALTVASVLGVLSTPVVAADDRLDTVLFTGADGYDTGGGVYAGFVTALDGDITTNGWTLSGNFTYSENWTSFANTYSTGASVLLGYQWHTPSTYTSLAFGVDVIDNTESPDRNSPNNGTHTGYILQAGFNTKMQNAPYVQAYGAYLSANDRVYLQLRGGWAGSNATFGLEAIHSDESNSAPSDRYGVFIADLPLGKGGFGVSFGVHDDRGTPGRDGGYLAVEYSIPLSLR